MGRDGAREGRRRGRERERIERALETDLADKVAQLGLADDLEHLVLKGGEDREDVWLGRVLDRRRRWEGLAVEVGKGLAWSRRRRRRFESSGGGVGGWWRGRDRAVEDVDFGFEEGVKFRERGEESARAPLGGERRDVTGTDCLA